MKLDAFYSYAELTEALEDLAAHFPRWVRLRSLTETPEGRQVHLAVLADFNLAEPEDRPAYWVMANIHAQEACGTNVSLLFMEKLLEAPEMLSRHIFYIVPRVNPDGAERSIMHRDSTIRSRCLPLGVRNALMPQDVDGDGMVGQMRRVNPMGAWKALPGRGVMVPREPGDVDGVFYDLWDEGLVENWDGGPVVPGERRIDLNRCYPVNWKPMSFSTDYPGQAPETRAVLEFLTSHPNIYAGVDLHTGTSGILRPTSRTNEQLVREDRQLMRSIAALASEITGFQNFFDLPYGAVPGEKAEPLPGDACDFWYDVLGLSHYTVELGNGYNSIGMPSLEVLAHYGDLNGELLERVEDFHQAHGSTVFLPWKPFRHPQLGDVDIGGMIGGQAYHMYLPDMETFAPKTAEFLRVHADMRARLLLGCAQTARLAPDIWRVRAECMNVGRFGTRVMQGSPGHLGKVPVRAFLTGAEILNADPERLIPQLGSMEKTALEWFVRAPAGTQVTLRVTHPKAEAAALTLTLA